jgi:hypothetical protein
MSKLLNAKQTNIINYLNLFNRKTTINNKDKRINKSQFSDIIKTKSYEGEWETLENSSEYLPTKFSVDWVFPQIPLECVPFIRGDILLKFDIEIPELIVETYQKYFYKSIYFINNETDFVELRMSFSVDMINSDINKMYAKPIIYMNSTMVTEKPDYIPKILSVFGSGGGG